MNIKCKHIFKLELQKESKFKVDARVCICKADFTGYTNTYIKFCSTNNVFDPLLSSQSCKQRSKVVALKCREVFFNSITLYFVFNIILYLLSMLIAVLSFCFSNVFCHSLLVLIFFYNLDSSFFNTS